MVFNIATLLFVLAAIFMNSMFGLFSGLINVVACIVSAAVAFGFFEPLNQLMTGELHLHPSYTEPFALLLPFVVTLLVLRLLADNLIRGNVRVPMYLDWGGGAACGFVIAQICVGMMALSFLMLPWGGRVAMYQAMERAEGDEIDPDTKRVIFEENQLWLKSDRFTVALVNLLSEGSLSTWQAEKRNDLATVYPDFARWVRWTGNTVQPESLTAPIVDKKGDGVKKGLSVESWWEQKTALAAGVTQYRAKNPTKHNDRPEQVRELYKDFAYKPEAGTRLIGARLKLTTDSADRDGRDAVHRFRPTMLRVVGDERGKPADYTAEIVGGADFNIGDLLRVADPDTDFTVPGGEPVTLDVYFEVDDGFQPRFIEYRRHARALMTPATVAKAAPGARIAAPVRDAQGNVQAQGMFRFIDKVIRERTGHITTLPFAMSETALMKSGENPEVEGKEFASGRVMGERAALTANATDVSKLKEPEGQWICQVGVQAREVRTMAGRIMNFVGGVLNQYEAVDREGGGHPLAGYYAIVKRDGQDYIEIFYTPAPLDAGSRGMLEWKNVKPREVEHDDTVWGLIFVVPKGKCIVSIRPGAGNREPIPIGEDLCE